MNNLREAHAHVPMLGRALSMLDLSNARSLSDVFNDVRNAHARLEAERWILGVGLRVLALREARWPTRAELDECAGDHACFLRSFDHHAGVGNSVVLRAAGVALDSAADRFGHLVERDARGQATGVLHEQAHTAAMDSAPKPTVQERCDYVERALDHFLELGYREVHDLLAPDWLGGCLARLRESGRHLPRIGLYAPMDEFEHQLNSSPGWTTPGSIELLGGKIFVDGTLNNATAWTLEPYAREVEHMHGTALMTVDDVVRAIETCVSAGKSLAAHAIGDGAVRCVLDAVERVGGSARGRVRIEHAEVIDERDVPRFAKLGVIASVQPCHLLYDIEALTTRLPHRLHRVLPLRDLIQSGLVPGETLLFGSDAPVVRANPQDSIDAAVNRARGEGCVAGPRSRAIAPEQAIDDATAWACFRGVLSG